jgi:type II secretory pathway pseudopilin PulG
MRESQRTRAGITLIEALVCLSIISLLLSLVAPAVQHSRALARKISCANNLQQISIAWQSFESQHRFFPSLKFSEAVTSPLASPHLRLLPHLAQSTLAAQTNWNEDGTGSSAMPPTSTQNSRHLRLKITVFMCPDDIPRNGSTNYRICTGSSPGLHQTSLNLGLNTGLIGVASGARSVADVKDGLSNTVFFSERVLGDGYTSTYTPRTDVALGISGNFLGPENAMSSCANISAVPGHWSFAGYGWIFGGYAHTWYNHVLLPNSRIPDCSDAFVLSGASPGAYAARSNHISGVNAGMGDGRVQFIADTIDLKVWRSLATIAGRESVTFE